MEWPGGNTSALKRRSHKIIKSNQEVSTISLHGNNKLAWNGLGESVEHSIAVATKVTRALKKYQQ
jgi:aspartate oxidase